MTTKTIIESDMTFGPFAEEQCFHIEKSMTYQKIRQGVRMAEFLLIRSQKRRPTVWIVEVKQSSPRSENQNFDSFISLFAHFFGLELFYNLLKIKVY